MLHRKFLQLIFANGRGLSKGWLQVMQLFKRILSNKIDQTIKKTIGKLIKLGLLVSNESLESRSNSNHHYLQMHYDLLQEIMLSSTVIDQRETPNSYQGGY